VKEFVTDLRYAITDYLNRNQGEGNFEKREFETKRVKIHLKNPPI
jgi:hypothetical protein